MRTSVLALVYCSIAVTGFGQNKQVEAIEITSRWGGLGTPQISRMTIRRKGSTFIADGKKIDSERIAKLLEAIEEPIIPTLSLKNIGVSEDVLKEKALKCVEDCVNGYIHRSNADQRQLFLSKYSDSNFAEDSIIQMYRGNWTDDYPSLEALIRFSDGEVVRIKSDSQKWFMLPWEIVNKEGNGATFNAHISRALSSIVPARFPNRERLLGKGLFEELARSVLRRIEPEWNRLDVLARLGETVRSLEKEYEIVAMEINSNHDSDFGTPWDTKPRPEQNLHIVLRRRHFPKSLALKVILPFENGQVQNIQVFQKDIDSYLQQVNSIPWLKEFIDSGKSEVWLRFVKDRSFSKKGMGSFVADMKTLGKEDLAAEVGKVQNQVALLSIGGGLEYYQSFWLVLPDGTAILWRHYYVSPLPGISFSGVECAENRSNTKPCVGALISREGTVIKD